MTTSEFCSSAQFTNPGRRGRVTLCLGRATSFVQGPSLPRPGGRCVRRMHSQIEIKLPFESPTARPERPMRRIPVKRFCHNGAFITITGTRIAQTLSSARGLSTTAQKASFFASDSTLVLHTYNNMNAFWGGYDVPNTPTQFLASR